VQAEESVSINRPVEDVFAFLASPENHARFVPDVLEFRLTSSTMGDGAEAVGTRRVFAVFVVCRTGSARSNPIEYSL
jgi:uncharacterized protein YndB with AHSA1/START domain